MYRTNRDHKSTQGGIKRLPAFALLLLPELALFAVGADDVGVLEHLERAAPPVGEVFLAQGLALGLLLLGELALPRIGR